MLGGMTVPDVTVDRTFTWALDSPGQTSHLPTINDTATAARLMLPCSATVANVISCSGVICFKYKVVRYFPF